MRWEFLWAKKLFSLKNIPDGYPGWEGTIDNAVWVYDDKSKEVESSGFPNLMVSGTDIIKDDKDSMVMVSLWPRMEVLASNENPDISVIRERFFGDISNLQPPEKNTLLEIKRVARRCYRWTTYRAVGTRG